MRPQFFQLLLPLLCSQISLLFPEARELAHSWGPRVPLSPAGSELSPSKSSLAPCPQGMGSVEGGSRKEGRETLTMERLFILGMFQDTVAKIWGQI